MNVISKCAELSDHVACCKEKGNSIGVVPTMGALHEGHLSLVRQSLAQTDETIVTIFVNPTQFAPTDDLDKYPRPFEEDCRKLEALGVQTVFAPANDEMYPPGCTTGVVPPQIAKPLEGEYRTTHFAGVATIVLKLLNLTQANSAFFGQKDYQQVLVVKHMVRDLNLPTEIVVCPIVREADGLALSSRNVYLSDAERESALALSRTLNAARQQIESGQRDGFTLITEMRQMLIDGGVTSIQYALVANPDTLATMDQIELPAVALVAAYLGETRLIDNCLIE